MQLVIDIDINDDIDKEFLTSISKDEQKNIFENLVKKYLTQTTSKAKADDEMDFVGMWADRQMNIQDLRNYSCRIDPLRNNNFMGFFNSKILENIRVCKPRFSISQYI